MSDNYNPDPFRDEQEEIQDENIENDNSMYHYSRPEGGRDEIPRWQPYEETEYRYSSPEPKRPKKKSNKAWVIPLVIVLAIMVIAITIGIIFGARRLNQMVANAGDQVTEQNDAGTGGKTAANANTGNHTGAAGKMILTDVSDVVHEVMPAVVSITSRQLVDSGAYGSYWDFFFGGGFRTPSGETQEVDAGYGSGTIIQQTDSELLILTSYHVVEGCSSLYVTFTDGSDADGYIKSQSAETDIAIVAIPLTNVSDDTLGAIRIASLSDTPAEVGDGCIVIGNALGYGMSVTTGIISATGRQIPTNAGGSVTVLQTDAAINAGNSGGCVVNEYGEIIGISEAKIIVENVEGMCYAIEINANREVIQTLLNSENGNAPAQAADQPSGQGAYLGVRGRDIDSSLANSYGMPQGIYVAGTVAGSGAEAAGLQEGDIIVGMDNVSFSTMNELQEQLSRHNPGDVVTLIIMRDANGRYSQMKVEVTLSDVLS